MAGGGGGGCCCRRGCRRLPRWRASAQEGGQEGVACRVGSTTFLRHCDVVGVVIISSSSSSSSTSSSSSSFSFSSSFLLLAHVFARSSRLRRSALVLPITLRAGEEKPSVRAYSLFSRVSSSRSFPFRLDAFPRHHPSIHLPCPSSRSHDFRRMRSRPSTIAHTCSHARFSSSFSLSLFRLSGHLMSNR